jgi:hypothetical protein
MQAVSFDFMPPIAGLPALPLGRGRASPPGGAAPFHPGHRLSYIECTMPDGLHRMVPPLNEV